MGIGCSCWGGSFRPSAPENSLRHHLSRGLSHHHPSQGYPSSTRNEAQLPIVEGAPHAGSLFRPDTRSIAFPCLTTMGMAAIAWAMLHSMQQSLRQAFDTTAVVESSLLLSPRNCILHVLVLVPRLWILGTQVTVPSWAACVDF